MNVQANGLVSMAAAVIVSAVIVGIVMVPIISNATTHTEIIDVPSTYNENPIGDLRLVYSEDSDLSRYFDIAVSESVASISAGDISEGVKADPDYTMGGLSDDQILFASDDCSITLVSGVVYANISGVSRVATAPISVEVSGGTVSIEDSGSISAELSYTFLYYPDAEGTYANYSSYTFDNGTMYAEGSFAGISVASQEGNVVGSNPMDFSATVQTEGDETTGVHYGVIE